MKISNVQGLLFEEFQKLDKAWTILVAFDTLIILIIFALTGMPWWSFFLMALIPVFIILFLGSMKLELRLDDKGVHFRTSSIFATKNESISWSDIDDITVRKFSGFMENSGYGKKTSKNKTVIRFEGSNALQVMRKNGHQLVFSTRKGKALEEMLKRKERPNGRSQFFS